VGADGGLTVSGSCLDDARRRACDNGPLSNIFRYHAICPYNRAFADPDAAQDHRSCANSDLTSQRRISMIVIIRVFFAERYVLQQSAIRARNDSVSGNKAHWMYNPQSRTEYCPRADLRSRAAN
jgi:hypothetical protein